MLHWHLEEIEAQIRERQEKGLTVLQRADPLPSEGLILGHWHPDLYHSKRWPVTCLFAMSFPAFHLISWNSAFSTVFELWLWRCAALTSIASMLVFIQFRRVVVRRRNPWTFLKVLPPGLYLFSRIVMMAEAFAALRASSPAVYETFVVSNYWVHLA